MYVLLEILKTTMPALIVFATVYFMMKNWLEAQIRQKMMDNRHTNAQNAFPLKLQAFERLTLFCERISIPNLVFRLRTEKMSAFELRNAMMLAVQQEFEHNISQQVYISNDLWKIIQMAKDNILANVNLVFQQIDSNADSLTFANALFDHIQHQASATDTAQQAIRSEAAALLN